MIHPTAVVDLRAQIDPTADIGPHVVIDGPVIVGARTRVLAHGTLLGRTTIGADNVIHSGAVIGDAPQDLSYTGAESFVRIGDRNILREHVTIHRGTKPDTATEIGDDNFLMAGSHVAHNCVVGNRVVLANAAVLGGYAQVGDQVFISAHCAVHQFVRVGRLALLRGLSRTSRDVPPFCIMDWTHTVRALNRVGLRRSGFTAIQVRALHQAFVHLFKRSSNLRAARDELASQPHSAEVAELLEFIRASKRGVCFGPRGSGPVGDDTD